MPVTSAGLLLYRELRELRGLEVFIAHMGGPFWARKQAGAWSIPKGEFTDEEPLAAAAASSPRRSACRRPMPT